MFKDVAGIIAAFLLGIALGVGAASEAQRGDPATGPFVVAALRVAAAGDKQAEDMKSIVTILAAASQGQGELPLRKLRTLVLSNVDNLESDSLNTAMLFFATLQNEIYTAVSAGDLSLDAKYDPLELSREILRELDAG